MSNALKVTLTMVAMLTLTMFAVSCSNQQSAETDEQGYLSDEAIEQVRAHIGQGYALLDSARVDEAVAEFARIEALAPASTVREYHTACAYARNGKTDEAFQWLNKMVEKGFDSPGRLADDPDFESLAGDARFDHVIQQAMTNFETKSAAFATGMPEYDTAPRTFASEDELDAWVQEENNRLHRQSYVWSATAYTAARIDLAARELACRRELKADDPEYDYPLERVREAARLVSLYEPWGAVADLVDAEIDAYRNGSPSDDGLSEVAYWSGLALSMKYGGQDARRASAFAEADERLANVSEGSDYFGAARALALVNRLRLPDADENRLGPELRQVIETHAGDRHVYRIVASQYGNDAVRLLWPIAFTATDLDGRKVSLAQYKGNVVLVDFWATWCPPCLEELPGMVEAYKEYHPKGFDILSISLDYADRLPMDDYRAWIAEHGMDWRHTYSGDGWNTDLVRRFYVGSIPAPFLIGRDGSLVAFGDDCRGEELVKTIERALGAI